MTVEQYRLTRAHPAAVHAVRWLQLTGGLFLFGIAIALMVRSGLGLGPWDAFHLGMHKLTGMSVGMANVVAGLVVLAGSMRLGARPGFGTLANIVLVGVFLDVAMPWVPNAKGLVEGLLYYVPAVLICGFATGMYIAPGLGKGPRDGLMVVLSERYGISVGRVRLALELTVLAFGWLMGGGVGLGTVLFALGIGPTSEWGLRLFGVTPGPCSAPVAESEPPPPAQGERRRLAA